MIYLKNVFLFINNEVSIKNNKVKKTKYKAA